MSCRNVCKMCRRLVLSESVAFTDGNLVITIPAGSYNDGENYCIVVAQAIPETTTINAPVVIQVGDGPVLYPLTKTNCAQATACSIRTRTKYKTRVVTSADTGTFRLLGNLPCAPNNRLSAINGDGTPVAPSTRGGN